MTQEEFDQIWWEIKEESYNRKKGAFKRALWYGGRTENLTLGQVPKAIPNIIVAKIGSGKGFRKAIRNAPLNIASAAVGGVATAGLSFIPGVGGTAQVGAKFGLKLAGKLISTVSVVAAGRIADTVSNKAFKHASVFLKEMATNQKNMGTGRKIKRGIFGRDEIFNKNDSYE